MTTQTATADSPITPAQVTPRDTPRAMLWTGRVLTALIVLFMLFDAYGKLAKIQPVVEGTTQAGYPESAIRPIGAAALLGAVLYAIPQTSVLGAIVLTGFLGGAVATHVRMADNNYFFAIIFGIVTWLGIYFRDARLRRLIPLRQ
jgi:hypothetical protein